MNHRPLVVVACALALTGCMTEVTASSRSYLLASQSGAVSTHTPLDAAREVTRLFGIRGFALADQHALATGGFELKLTKSDRAIAATKDDDANVGSRDIGSVFYVWVAPDATGSAIMMVGKPTLNGAEPCSKEIPELACQQVTADPTFASTFMSGKAEADVVHGVLSELALEGFATGSLPASTAFVSATPAVSDPCLRQRDAAFAQAQAISDPTQRAKVLERAPVCTD